MNHLRKVSSWPFAAVLALFALVHSATAIADGSETLGPPSIGIASGTGFVADGVGLGTQQPGNINITIPNGASVEQVLIYWEGLDTAGVLTSTIVVGGSSVTGTRIGGPIQAHRTRPQKSSTFRADITNLGLVQPGNNSVSVSGLNFDIVNNGAGILAVIDDGSGTSTLLLRDGDDYAYSEDPNPPRDTTVPQTFNFASAASNRTATITNFFASVQGAASSGGPQRPTSIIVTVAGTTYEFNDQLGSVDGEEWDTLVISVPVPAGATSLTIQALSEDRSGVGETPASFNWLTSGVAIPPPEQPPIAKLGDRVFEDRNRNGVQDCTDSNGNGILGDAGDQGAECDAGIPNIPVSLLAGDCSTPLGSMVMTDGDGFYLFDNLQPGSYCVEFGLPPEDFCDTNGFELGGPQFTTQNAGGDAVDSDANTGNGRSDAVNLAAGETNRTVDAGVFCPAKIGDFVWFDDNENGLQENGEGGVPGVKAILFECGDDMIAGTPDDVATGEMRTTGNDGMYMFGAEPGYTLPPGKYFVQFDPNSLPPGYDYTMPGAGPDAIDSDCRPSDGITACTDLTASRSINMNRDCGLVPPPPPECNLFLDKLCRVEAPAPDPDFDKCSGKLQQFTLVWTGDGSITAAGPNNTVTVDPGDEATFLGPFSNNDVIVNISGDVNGQSTFHVSCSDEDFNDPSDCGKLAGNGKNNDGNLINAWRLEGFVDADGRVLDCTADGGEGGFSDNCSFEPQPLPTCENGPKPDTLTWRYDGGSGGDGDCADSTFYTIVNEDGKPHGDFVCEGDTIQTGQGSSISVVDDDNVGYVVGFGESFTTPRDAIGAISLTDSNGNQQDLQFHSSCSQPLQAGATAGALTLVALDERDGAQDVTYRYELTNFGDPLTNVGIEDDQLGTIASGLSLAKGGEASFEKMAQIFGTTVNIAQASGTLSSGATCAPSSASDSVTVEAVVPPCSLSFELYKVEDDKLKIKISNNDTRSRTVTLQSLTVAFPAARGDIEKIKLAGDAYKRDDSSNPIDGTPASFGPSDWTESDVSKRQIEAGKTETLEIETTDKSSKDGRFDLDLDFGQDCRFSITVDGQQLLRDS